MNQTTYPIPNRPSAPSRVNCRVMAGTVGCRRVSRPVAEEPRMRKTKFAVYLSEAERAQLRTLVGHGEAPHDAHPRSRPAQSQPRGGRAGLE